MFQGRSNSSICGKSLSINNSFNNNKLSNLISHSDENGKLCFPFSPDYKNALNIVSNCSNVSYSRPRTSSYSKFLPPKNSKQNYKKTLILDLDETLVHSGFTLNAYREPDIVLNVDIEGKKHDIFVLVRPGAEEFLINMSKMYEIVIFTASMSKYAIPLIEKLDSSKVCDHKLFREHCYFINKSFVKDLNNLGRDMKDVIIVDNNPISYSLNNENGLPIKTWTGDINDRELFKITPVLEYLSSVKDVREFIKEMRIANDFSAQSLLKKTHLNPKNNPNYSTLKKNIIKEALLNKNNENSTQNLENEQNQKTNINIKKLTNNFTNYYNSCQNNLSPTNTKQNFYPKPQGNYSQPISFREQAHTDINSSNLRTNNFFIRKPQPKKPLELQTNYSQYVSTANTPIKVNYQEKHPEKTDLSKQNTPAHNCLDNSIPTQKRTSEARTYSTSTYSGSSYSRGTSAIQIPSSQSIGRINTQPNSTKFIPSSDVLYHPRIVLNESNISAYINNNKVKLFNMGKNGMKVSTTERVLRIQGAIQKDEQNTEKEKKEGEQEKKGVTSSRIGGIGYLLGNLKKAKNFSNYKLI